MPDPEIRSVLDRGAVRPAHGAVVLDESVRRKWVAPLPPRRFGIAPEFVYNLARKILYSVAVLEISIEIATCHIMSVFVLNK